MKLFTRDCLYFYLLLLWIPTVTVKGQSLPFSYFNSESGNHKVKFERSLDHDQKYDHLLLKEIALDQLKDLDKVYFRLNYDIVKRIEPADNDSLDIALSFDLAVKEGDIYTRSFSIADQLIPEFIQCRVILKSQRNKYYNQQFKFANIPVIKNKAFVSFKIDPEDKYPDYYLLTDSVSFTYTKKDLDELIDYHQYIKDFYSAILLIDTTFHFIDYTRDYDPDSVYKYIINLEKAKSIQKFIRSYRFDTLTDGYLEKQKADLFLNKTALFDRYVSMFSFYLEEMIKTLQPGFIAITNNDVADYYVSVNNYFEKLNNTASLNHYHFISHFINDYDYRRLPSYYNSWLCKISEKADERSYLFSGSLTAARKITGILTKRAEEYIPKAKYKEAFELLSTAKRFSEYLVPDYGSKVIQTLMSQALYGMYNSFLTIAERAIENRNPQMAMVYLEKADYYQRTYKDYILSDKKVRDQKHILLNLYIKKGAEENERRHFSRALSCFEQATQLCLDLDEFNFSYELKDGMTVAKNGIYEDILSRSDSCLLNGNLVKADYYIDLAENYLAENNMVIASGYKIRLLKDQLELKKYSKLVESGIAFYHKNNYKQAFLNLKKAYTIERTNNYKRNEQLLYFLSLASNPFFELMIDEGLLSVVQDDVEKASDLYFEMIMTSQDLGLSLDTVSKTGLSKLYRYITAKTCQNAEIEFDNMMYKAKMYCRQKDYITAMDYFDAALNISEANKSCQILDTIVYNLRNEFILPADFQMHIKELPEILGRGDTLKFFNKYIYIDHFFASNILLLGDYVDHTNLLNYLGELKNERLIIYGISYFESSEDIKSALALLRILRENGYNENLSAGIQKRLGQKISLIDQHEFPNRDPRSEVLKYTGGDKWFREFRNGYVSSWEGSHVRDNKETNVFRQKTSKKSKN